ncbi:uncharacterized protein LOC143011574 isoform X1 [Genypterus blacodes]|uniref:uncharacterized protein LOC143011574 isoform X1 n=1 Tax=Genypterus blacodes TaxID=154954 RepID=UPI003F76FE21
MTNARCVFLTGLIWLLQPTAALPLPDLDLGGGVGTGTHRDGSCRNDLEYMSGNICCRNCPAGTYLQSPCTRAGETGTCVECDDGTFTAHDNSLKMCLKCTRCRQDQQYARRCSHKEDAECECMSERFCAHEEACEVCKRCTRCANDEVKVRNCTSTSNSECKKVLSYTDSASDNVAAVVVPLVAAAVLIAFTVICVVCRRRRRATDSQRNTSDGLKDGQDYRDDCPSEDRRNGDTRRPSYFKLMRDSLVRAKSTSGVEEKRELCESLASSASNSQHSLTAPPPPLLPPAPPPRSSLAAPQQPVRREMEQFPKLVAVDGEKSLKNCFEYFEELDIDYHRRFFRCLTVNDNEIKSKERLNHGDTIHELLHIWMEKVGKEAHLDHLLRALLELGQRLTAENIRDRAVNDGHYVYEEE